MYILNTFYSVIYCQVPRKECDMTLFAQSRASLMCSHVHVLTYYRQKNRNFLFMQIIIFPHVRFWPILDMLYGRLFQTNLPQKSFLLQFYLGQTTK